MGKCIARVESNFTHLTYSIQQYLYYLIYTWDSIDTWLARIYTCFILPDCTRKRWKLQPEHGSKCIQIATEPTSPSRKFFITLRVSDLSSLRKMRRKINVRLLSKPSRKSGFIVSKAKMFASWVLQLRAFNMLGLNCHLIYNIDHLQTILLLL